MLLNRGVIFIFGNCPSYMPFSRKKIWEVPSRKIRINFFRSWNSPIFPKQISKLTLVHNLVHNVTLLSVEGSKMLKTHLKSSSPAIFWICCSFQYYLSQKRSGKFKIKMERNWFESRFYHASIFKEQNYQPFTKVNWQYCTDIILL